MSQKCPDPCQSHLVQRNQFKKIKQRDYVSLCKASSITQLSLCCKNIVKEISHEFSIFASSRNPLDGSQNRQALMITMSSTFLKNQKIRIITHALSDMKLSTVKFSCVSEEGPSWGTDALQQSPLQPWCEGGEWVSSASSR